MAGGTNLPAANWHAYAPSAAETTILGNMPNIPGATSLLAGYGAENSMAQGAYDAQRQQATDAALRQQGIVNNQEQQKILTDQLKFAASAVGGVDAITSNPYTAGGFAGTNLAPLRQGAIDKQAGVTFEQAGKGAQGLSAAGVTGADPQLSNLLHNPNATIGENNIVTAARLQADSRIGAAQIGANARTAQNGAITVTGGDPLHQYSYKVPRVGGETAEQTYARVTGQPQIPAGSSAAGGSIIQKNVAAYEASGNKQAAQDIARGDNQIIPGGAGMPARVKGHSGVIYTLRP